MTLLGMGTTILLVFSLALAVLLIVIILIFISLKRILQKETHKMINDKNWNYKKSLNDLQLKLSEKDLREIMDSLHELIKTFFRDYLKLSYELTYEEIITELSKEKKGVMIDFIRHFEILRYQQTEVTKEDLDKIIKEFDIILSENKISNLESDKKESALNKIKEQRLKGFYEGIKNQRIEKKQVKNQELLDQINTLEKKYNEWRKKGYDVSPLKNHILTLKQKNQELIQQNL